MLLRITLLLQREISRFAIGVSKSSILRILTRYNASVSTFPKRRGKSGIKRKTTTRNVKIPIRYNKINLRKTRSDHQRILLDSGFRY